MSRTPPTTQYYEENEQPIYHQADQSEQNLKRCLSTSAANTNTGGGGDNSTTYGRINCICSSSRDCQRRICVMEKKPSMKAFIGISDVCGNKKLLKMLGAELIGTGMLVFVGCGGWIASKHDYLMTAFAFGIAVATIAQALGHVSGAHLNPAVSLGLVAAGECSILKAIVYIVAQCMSWSDCWTNFVETIPDIPEKLLSDASQRLGKQFESRYDNLCLTLLANSNNVSNPDLWNVVSPINGILIEAVITFVLVLTVCGVCDNLRKDVKGSAPLAIGLSIFVCHIMAIAYTGSSMNPARSLGPAIVSSGDYRWNNHYVYWAGPILGGITAGFLYQLAFKERPSSPSFPEEEVEGRSPMLNRRDHP